jgi:hypothetical protein
MKLRGKNLVQKIPLEEKGIMPDRNEFVTAVDDWVEADRTDVVEIASGNKYSYSMFRDDMDCHCVLPLMAGIKPCMEFAGT